MIMSTTYHGYMHRTPARCPHYISSYHTQEITGLPWSTNRRNLAELLTVQKNPLTRVTRGPQQPNIAPNLK